MQSMVLPVSAVRQKRAFLLFYILPGCAITIRILTVDKKERKYAFSNKQSMEVSPYVEPQGLPLLLTLFIVLFLPIIGLVAAISYFFGNFVLVFLHISIYNAVLMLLLPFLRKHISSRVCATLWILPNILYIAFIPLVQKDHPLFIIPMNITLGDWETWLWLIGFAAVMLYQIINHLLILRSKFIIPCIPQPVGLLVGGFFCVLFLKN